MPIWGPWCLPQAIRKNKFGKEQAVSLKNSVYKSKSIYSHLGLRVKKNGSEKIEIALLFKGLRLSEGEITSVCL